MQLSLPFVFPVSFPSVIPLPCFVLISLVTLAMSVWILVTEENDDGCVDSVFCHVASIMNDVWNDACDSSCIAG